MSLFQKSVEKKYLNNLDPALINKKYADFQNYFGNPERQGNIRNSKEEQFQEGFLRELFVNILGYTLNPEPDFNLTTELKNISNSKKADGAILKNENAHSVIELKSTNTTDLDSIETQAFGYKNHHPKCVYVITSNFEKLRFYIQNAVDHIDFDLFKLTKEQFSLLWLCLAKDNLLNDLPLKIKDSSVLQEENITKKLYTDYSKFRRAIYNNLIKNNPDKDKLLLFKKTQKLLDRFLFIFFAEDRLLLPPNSISQIVKQWQTLKDELDEYIPLYARFKKYFGYMNTGFKGKKYDIYAYNGGLFKPDEILDNILIDDDILHEHTVKLSNYDFETDVDVNILGHIFEHSLGKIENVQAEIKGEKIDSQKTKRKKDGIFYTPKYITKYIVENTVGKLCNEKRTELNIVDEEYAKGRKNRKKDIVRTLNKKLDEYRNWLLSLTILDPACGSGAFLNQALEFLINEHKKIDELRAQLFGGAIIFSDITTDILEKNIFGVDLNEESVEIAKLSLWLRTAQKGRKLNTLSNNIKCGNSLIDDPEVAGEKAFNWQNEFPEIFAKGGFDVVIGNPPYVNFANLPKEQRAYFKKNSKVCKNKTDLYAFFVEKSTKILKSIGRFSFIFPHTWVSTTSFTPLRKLFFENYNINSLVELEHGVFQDAVVKTVIIVCTKGDEFKGIPIYNDKFQFIVNIPKEVIFNDDEMTINFDWNPAKQVVENRLFNDSVRLDSILRFSRGIKTSNDKRFLCFEKKNDEYKKVIRGRNIKAYRVDFEGEFIWYRPDLMKEKVGCLPHTKKLFEVKEKLITQRVNSSGELLVTYDDKQHYCLDTTNVSVIEKKLDIDLKYILVILNSRLINWWFNDKFKMPTISGYELHQIPIKINKSIEKNVIEFGNLKLKKAPEFRDVLKKFTTHFQSKYQIEKLSKKLQNWHELDFAEFLKELKKAKVHLSLSEEAEWMQYFNEQKEKAQVLKSEIDKTDKQIDQIIYELYGLTEEEIKIVENS